MKSKHIVWIAIVVFIMGWLLGCGLIQVKDDDSGVLAKIIARRLGATCAARYPILASQIEPIATAILESSANGDDLITILRKGIAETPLLDALTKRDIQDLLELIEVNNVPEVYQKIAGAFLEGVIVSSPLNLPQVN